MESLRKREMNKKKIVMYINLDEREKEERILGVVMKKMKKKKKEINEVEIKKK